MHFATVNINIFWVTFERFHVKKKSFLHAYMNTPHSNVVQEIAVLDICFQSMRYAYQMRATNPFESNQQNSHSDSDWALLFQLNKVCFQAKVFFIFFLTFIHIRLKANSYRV